MSENTVKISEMPRAVSIDDNQLFMVSEMVGDNQYVSKSMQVADLTAGIYAQVKNSIEEATSEIDGIAKAKTLEEILDDDKRDALVQASAAKELYNSAKQGQSPTGDYLVLSKTTKQTVSGPVEFKEQVLCPTPNAEGNPNDAVNRKFMEQYVKTQQGGAQTDFPGAGFKEASEILRPTLADGIQPAIIFGVPKNGILNVRVKCPTVGATLGLQYYCMTCTAATYEELIQNPPDADSSDWYPLEMHRFTASGEVHTWTFPCKGRTIWAVYSAGTQTAKVESTADGDMTLAGVYESMGKASLLPKNTDVCAKIFY